MCSKLARLFEVRRLDLLWFPLNLLLKHDTMVSMVVVTCLFYYALEEIHQASTVNIPLIVLKT